MNFSWFWRHAYLEPMIAKGNGLPYLAQVNWSLLWNMEIEADSLRAHELGGLHMNMKNKENVRKGKLWNKEPLFKISA